MMASSMLIPGVSGLRALGSGGFAEVYAGLLDEDGSEVAVKVLPAAASLRAEREAAALEQVGPPIVPRLHRRSVTGDGRPCLIMELMTGPSLAGRELATRDDLVAALARAAAAVDGVHAAGWVHRDLKPEHVVARGESMALLDLGSARRIGPAVHDAWSPALTMEGGAPGTPRYMAPEQCAGRIDVGPAADVYALGVIAYELLAGRPPFAGEPALVRSAHMAEAPPLLSALAELPDAVDDVILRCLAKDPSLRHPSAAEFAAALASALARAARSRPVVHRPAAGVRRTALLALRSRRPVTELDALLPGGAIVARARGERVVLALTAPGSLAGAIMRAVRLAHLLSDALGAADAVVHVAPVGLRRRGDRVLCTGSALDDPRWHGEPFLAAGPVALTRAAVDELEPADVAGLEAADRLAPAEPPPLVGRDAMLAELVDDAARPGLVTLLGAPGAGKTRLLAELHAALERRGVEVVLCSAQDLMIGRGVSLASTIGLGPGHGRPAAILIDDAHRGDGAALDAIERAALPPGAAGDAGGRPLWICAAALPGLLERRPGWDARAGRAERRIIEPLGPDDAARLLRELLAVEFVPDPVVRRLVDAAGGLPLQLAELAWSLRRGGALRVRPGTDGIYVAADQLLHMGATPLAARMAQRALAGLPPSTVALARLASVLGERIELADLEAAARAAGGPSIDARVGMARLEAAGVVSPAAPDVWRFTRATLGQGIADGAVDRERLHRAALEVELARPVPRPARLAEHAAALGDSERAFAACAALAAASAEVADWVEAELAWTAAMGHLAAADPRREQVLTGRGQARHRLQRLDDALADLEAARVLAAERGGRAAEVDLLLDIATAEEWRMRWDESRAAALAARDLAAGVDDARLAARVDLALGRSACRRFELDEAIALLSRAADSPAADPETRTIALVLLAPHLSYADRNDEAADRFAEVVDLCSATGDDFHLAAALTNRSLLSLRLERHDQAERDLRRAVDLARRHGAAQLERLASQNLAEMLYWTGDLTAALPLAGRALALQTRFSGPDQMADDALLLARIHLAAGDRDAAEAARRRAGATALPRQRALARLVDLVLAGAGHDEWVAAERDVLSHAIYDEIAAELHVWAARTLLAGGDAIHAREWLERARTGSGRAFRAQVAALDDALSERVEAYTTEGPVPWSWRPRQP